MAVFSLAQHRNGLCVSDDIVDIMRRLHPADDRTETMCNVVAAEFLVLVANLRNAWQRVRHEADPHRTLARRFKVSEIVMACRLLDLGLMTRKKIFAFYEAYRQRWQDAEAVRDESGGHFFNTQNVRGGQRFCHRGRYWLEYTLQSFFTRSCKEKSCS